MINHFEEKYQTYNNTSLLEIIGNPGEYQSEAVDAAKTVLSSRKLSESEMAIANSIVLNNVTTLDEIEDDELIEEISDGFEGWAQKISRNILLRIWPVKASLPASERIMLVLSIFLCCFYAYILYAAFPLLKYTAEGEPVEGTILLFLCIPVLLFPLGIFLFYKHNKVGWTILALFLSSCVMDGTINLIVQFHNETDGFSLLFFYNMASLLLCSLSLRTICTNLILQTFRLDNGYMWICIVGGSVLSLLLLHA